MPQPTHQFNRREFLAALGLTGAALMAGPERIAHAKRPPNIVFILIDDMGWADAKCNGSTFYETPNIDKLAAEGVRFTDAYAACPVCSPTRASIMTGKYPATLHLTDWLKSLRTRKDSPVLPALYVDELPLDEVTIAEALKTAGYATCHVGKWHLGGPPYYPQHQGFDVNDGGCEAGSPKAYFWPEWDGRPPIEGHFDGEYLPERLSQDGCSFIREHKDQPFFLYLAHYSVHIPLGTKQEYIKKYEQKLKEHPPKKGEQDNPVYAGMIEAIDKSVGLVLETLKECGIDDDTIVVFFSDNGGLSIHQGPHTPATTNAPLRGGKGYLYEGGVREPLIVRWPGVTPAGAVCHEPVCSIDFFPTLCHAAGLDPAKVKTHGPIDGIDITKLLKNPDAHLDRNALFWHYPHFSDQGGRPGGAVRMGDWKLIQRYEDGSLELYNLKNDISETTNLASQDPKRAQTMLEKLVAWRRDVKANMPRPNPNYKGPPVNSVTE